MTGSQRLVLVLGLVLLAGCLLFSPRNRAGVDLALLFTQMGAVAALTGGAFVALGWRRKP